MNLEAWPELPYEAWSDTCATLHLWTQIVGKIRLARSPWLNHGWHVTLYVTTNGLTTSPSFTGAAPGLRQDVMQEAYSHEVSSAGFWPGGNGTDAAFYSYAYPVPPGFEERSVRPEGAFFSEPLGEFLLPYARMRAAKDPEAALLGFLQSSYEAAADCGKWDRAALECSLGLPGVPRGRINL